MIAPNTAEIIAGDEEKGSLKVLIILSAVLAFWLDTFPSFSTIIANSL